ncbi:hypothetical protein SLA2020_335530 [Shorea laevis]
MHSSPPRSNGRNSRGTEEQTRTQDEDHRGAPAGAAEGHGRRTSPGHTDTPARSTLTSRLPRKRHTEELPQHPARPEPLPLTEGHRDAPPRAPPGSDDSHFNGAPLSSLSTVITILGVSSIY